MLKRLLRGSSAASPQVWPAQKRTLLIVATAGVIAALAAGATHAATTASAAAGGTLTVAVNVTSPILDPSIGGNQYEAWSDLAYDPLIVKETNGDYSPGLALSWSYGPRNKSFSIKLRPGVRFSDGSKLTAQAVKTWLQHAIAYPGGTAASDLKALTAITVKGQLSLKLVFNAPTPNLPLDFSQVLMIGDVASPKNLTAKSLATKTDGAGPYMLDTSQTVTGDHYTYVPNPYYWNKSAIHWKKVVLKEITNPSAGLSALETGQVQVVMAQTADSIKAAKAAGQKFVAPLTLYMGLDLLDRGGAVAKPLGDLRVRQAINYAINRPAIANLLGLGYGVPIDQLAVPGDDAYDKAKANRYPYDPTKAKQLLAAAGYPNGFSMSVVTTPIVGMDTMAQAIAGQLAQVGIKLDVQTVDGGSYSTQMASQKFPAGAMAWGRLPTVNNYQLLYGPQAIPIFNPFKSHNPQLDSLYYKLAAAPLKKVNSIAKQMNDFLVENAWFAPVASTPLVNLYSPKVSGVNVGPGRDVIYLTEIKPA